MLGPRRALGTGLALLPPVVLGPRAGSSALLQRPPLRRARTFTARLLGDKFMGMLRRDVRAQTCGVEVFPTVLARAPTETPLLAVRVQLAGKALMRPDAFDRVFPAAEEAR